MLEYACAHVYFNCFIYWSDTSLTAKVLVGLRLNHVFDMYTTSVTFSNVPVCYRLHNLIKACISDHIASNVAVTLIEVYMRRSRWGQGVQCWAIIGTPAKRHLIGVSLAGQ